MRKKFTIYKPAGTGQIRREFLPPTDKQKGLFAGRAAEVATAKPPPDLTGRTCTRCGSRFLPYSIRQTICKRGCGYGFAESDLRRGRRVEYITVDCNFCGKSLERVPSKVKNTNFCGRACVNAFVRREHESLRGGTLHSGDEGSAGGQRLEGGPGGGGALVEGA